MRTSSRVFVLVFFGMIAAAVTNAARPNGLPWIKPDGVRVPAPGDDGINHEYAVTLDELRAHLQNYTAVFIDAREPHEFEQGHLPRAINVPAGDRESHMGPVYANVLPDSTLVIIYCGGGQCDASKNIFEYLQLMKFKKLKIFEKGWDLLSTLPDIPKETGSGQYADPSQTQPGMDAAAAPAGS